MIVKLISVLIITTTIILSSATSIQALCCDTRADDPIICGQQAIACSDGYTRCDTAAECGDLIHNSPFNTRANPASYFFDAWINAIGLNRDLTSISGIINAIIPFLFVIAGLILFFMLIAGGYDLLLSGANPKSAETGKQRITAAIVGFLVVFASYWIVQIIEIIFGINILGN